MFGYLGHACAVVILCVWHALSPQSWRRLPQPAATATVHAPGVNADRILLVGSGGTVGYGVLSHDLGIAGHLARRVSELTGRGTDVDVIGAQGMGPAGAQTVISGARLSRYDVVVLNIGGFEALQLTPRSRWRRKLAALLDSIIAAAPDSLSIVTVGLAALPTLVPIPARFEPFVVSSTDGINDESIALAAARPQVTFLPFAPRRGDFLATAGSDLYAQWAALMAPTVAMILDTHAVHSADPAYSALHSGDPLDSADPLHRADPLNWTDPEDEQSRLRALRELGRANRGPDQRIDRVVANARDLFGVTGASLNFVESEHLWVGAASGIRRDNVPRHESACDVTIRSSHVYVIEDTAADDRYAAMSKLVDPVRFYAGYPLQAPDGHRVGTLCIVDREPRVFSGADISLLRDLALQVQALLWANLEAGFGTGTP